MRAQKDFRLRIRRLFLDRDRRIRLFSLGASFIRQRAVSLREPCFLVFVDGRGNPVGGQSF
jgi:hypothetical protein